LVYYLFLSTSEIKAQKEVMEETATASTSFPIEKLTRISVKKNKEIHTVTLNQILYIEANGDYVLIHTEGSKYLKDRTMKYWETHLPDDLFVRIHRSFIINIEWITKIELYEKETYKVQLKNGNSLKASSAGYKLLKQKMQL
jgi:DNA-binding LytR/AlgR family response regulator